MRKSRIISLVLFASFLGSTFAEAPPFDVIRPQAIEILRSDLHNAEPQVKVHAADALLELGYIEGVEDEFRKELALSGDQPEYRIGIWYILADASVTSFERAQWIDRIRVVSTDPSAPDQSAAAETLRRLETLVKRDTATSQEEWLSSDSRELAVSALKSQNAPERIKACQDLGRFGTADDRGLLLPLLEDVDPDVRVYAAKGLLTLERQKTNALSIIDWAVLGGYFLSLMLIGGYYARKTKTAEDYLLGGRNLPSWMVGLSLFAALLSTATYMSVPGEIVKHGPMIMAQLVCIPFVAWVVGWFLIPTFMKLKVTSANEILEMRMGLSVRMLGSAFFLFSRLAWMAMIIFITAKAVLAPMLGVSPEYFPWLCVLLGVITMAYTSSGGLKAAVLADVIQSFILFAGAILAILLITFRLKGFGWFPTHWAPTWDPPVFWFDADARVTFMGAGMMMFFWYICVSGSDQVAVQRFLSTKDLKAARKAFNVNLLAVALVIIFLGILGFALYGYFLACPHELAAGMNLRTDADQIFPHFIVSGLPPGISGLIVAGLLAAALSSLSAGLNSTCAVVTVDFLDRFSKKKLDEKHHVTRARIVSVMIGFLVIGLSLLVEKVPGNFLEIINKLGNLLVAPLFTLFFMAIFVPFANSAGTWVGAATAVAMAIGIAFYEILGLSFLWIMPCSLISGVIVGCLFSLLFGGKKKSKL